MIETQHRLVLNGQDSGPFTIRQLQSMWHAGTITSETDHWMEGYSEWLPLDFIREDLEPPVQAARTVPSPVVAAVPAVAALPPTMPTVDSKVRLVYILLALFLGFIGIHNFYAGRFGQGCLQLTLWLGLPLAILVAAGFHTPDFLMDPWLAMAIVSLIPLCDILMVTTDGKGQKMI